MFSVREQREGISWKFCPSQRDFREAVETRSHLSRRSLHRLSKSCILAHLNELTDAVNKKVLPLDVEKGIISDVWTGGRFSGKASMMSKKCAYI